MTTYQIQLLRGTSSSASSNNKKIAVAELAYETNTNKIKVGDGGSRYNDIRYAIVIDNATQTLTNKSVSGLDNTLVSIPNSSLTNKTFTVNNDSVELSNNLVFGSWATSVVTSNITLSKNYLYLVDTSVSRTLTMPSSPSQGDEVKIADYQGGALANPIVLASNKFNGISDSFSIDKNNALVHLIYISASYGWKIL
jgi:hypothetical protein